ncbi:MAG: 1-deoxy-D-xylulose-5-phosphate reductoisomerase [Verrucomicrobia bacterium TMED175]|nr:MAG: 1-deoxy-D-xylulose-5-phosphate reductoisomerase [Verrucomicrobia bacterium TMED175]
MRNFISVLGSTGSIGLSVLTILKKKNSFTPYLFSANKNYDLICKQVRQFKPKYFLISDDKIFNKVKKKFKFSKTKIINNLKIKKFKTSQISIMAIPGIAGLNPTLTMVKKSKKILLANKESIVCGWKLIKNASLKHKTKIIPIDSEHFSIFKLLENKNINEVEKIFLTASGGPFLNYKPHQLKKINPKNALKHPKWKMGKKITIDSSTLMNKVLEYIEAQKLFNLPKEKLEILIHPESLVHAIVRFKNGLIKFIYHDTSMIIPITNAIFEKNLDIDKFFQKKKEIKNLSFEKPKLNNFPILNILDRVNEFPSTSIIINASNEVLVDLFLRNKVPFLSIPNIIKEVLNDRNYKKYAIKTPKDLKQIKKIDSWAKTITLEKIRFKYE